MYNRRILISEDEKSRILNLHENRKSKEWGFIFEQASTAATTSSTAATTNTACTSAPGLKSIDDEIAFRAFAKKNYGQEVVQFGKISIPGFVDKPTVFCNPKFKALGVVYNHKPASGGGKSIGELYLAGGSGSSSSSTASYTVDMGGGKTQVMDSAALKTAIESGQIKNTTKIWKKGLQNWIDAGTAEDLKDFFAGVAPELKGPDKIYKISPDGKSATMKEYTADQVIAAIKDKTLSNQYVIKADGSGFESIMNNPELAKIVQTTMGPADVTPERKPTGIPELDTWLKGPIGSAWDQIKDLKQKESMFDSFEKTDPTISKLKDTVGKNKVRAALGMKADTMLGRAFQGGREKLGKAIMGTQPQA